MKMSEKSGKTILHCNVIILTMEILILIWIMALLKPDEDFSRQSSNKKVTLSETNSHLRARRSLRQSAYPKIKPTNSRTCQRLFDVWNTSCQTSRDSAESRSLSNREEQSFVKDILDSLYSFRNSLNELVQRNFPQRASDESPSRDVGVDYFNTEISYAELWEENLTSAEKCRREGLEGSLACEFEYDNPQKAAKLFKLLRPLFALENGTNERAIRTNDESSSPLSKSSQIHIENEEGTSRQKRNTENKIPILTRSKRSPLPSMEGEVCSTTLSTRSVAQACHARSGRMVSLYMFRGANQTRELHTQQFEIGFCTSDTPTAVQSSSGTNIACRPAMIRILAYIVATAKQATSGNYRRCFTNIQPNYVVCRDFVLIPALCKLFHNNPQ